MEKYKATCLEKYGVESFLQTEQFKQKSKDTCLEKYDVEYAIQNAEIMEKCSKNAYKLKEYKFPSERVEKIQGYEHYALNELIQNKLINEDDIFIGAKNVPSIWYNDESGKKHKHYVDIFIKSENLCIEVKSTWTVEKKKDIVFLKQNAAKELGYKYEIWVYDGKGVRVEKYE
jgi:CRISPR/Cas system type I-B associated protein Csh2 (Cas7 group RAMP superfamily)